MLRLSDYAALSFRPANAPHRSVVTQYQRSRRFPKYLSLNISHLARFDALLRQPTMYLGRRRELFPWERTYKYQHVAIMARNPMARSPRKTASAPRAKRCLNNPDQNHIDSLQPRFAFARPGLVPSPPQTPPARRPTIWISRPDASTGRDPGILPFERTPVRKRTQAHARIPRTSAQRKRTQCPPPESLAPIPSENEPNARARRRQRRPAKTNPASLPNPSQRAPAKTNPSPRPNPSHQRTAKTNPSPRPNPRNSAQRNEPKPPGEFIMRRRFTA